MRKWKLEKNGQQVLLPQGGVPSPRTPAQGGSALRYDRASAMLAARGERKAKTETRKAGRADPSPAGRDSLNCAPFDSPAGAGSLWVYDKAAPPDSSRDFAPA